MNGMRRGLGDNEWMRFGRNNLVRYFGDIEQLENGGTSAADWMECQAFRVFVADDRNEPLLWCCFLRLSEIEQDALTIMVLEGIDQVTAAELLGVRVVTAKSRKKQGVRRLRIMMAEIIERIGGQGECGDGGVGEGAVRDLSEVRGM